MKTRSLPVLLLGLGLVACEQESQPLPFATNAEAGVSRTLSAEGGLISNPGGAAVRFPANALATATTVSLSQVEAPAALEPSGTVATPGFRLEPAGTRLGVPATAELKFDPSLPGAWLASIVNVTPEGLRELGNSRVDLTTGIVRARIAELGTLAVVLPASDAVFSLHQGGAHSLAPAGALAALAASGTDSVSARCGDPENRCEALTVDASENLVSRVENAAVVYPLISGALRFQGSTVEGELTLDASFRAELKSGATAENVTIHARIEPTAATAVSETDSEIVITNLRHVVAGSADSGSATQEHLATLVVPKTGERPSITVSRSFQLRDSAGALEDAFVSVAFPVSIHQ